MLEEGVEPEPVLANIGREYAGMLTERFSSFAGSTFDARFEALKDLHLHTAVSWDLSPPGSMKTIYIMLIITIGIAPVRPAVFVILRIEQLAGQTRP